MIIFYPALAEGFAAFQPKADPPRAEAASVGGLKPENPALKCVINYFWSGGAWPRPVRGKALTLRFLHELFLEIFCKPGDPSPAAAGSG